MRVHDHPIATSSRPSSQGFALVVALLLMVALSFIGVSALRNVSLQEKMSGNLYYRAVALHEAEGALRFARQRVEADWQSDSIPAANFESTLGVWGKLVDKPMLSYFTLAANWATATSLTSLLSARPVASQYVIEQLPGKIPRCGSTPNPSDCDAVFVRATARAVDPATNASIVTQEWAMYPK